MYFSSGGVLPVYHKQQRKHKHTELPGVHPSDTFRAGSTARAPSEGTASGEGFHIFWQQVYQVSPLDIMSTQTFLTGFPSRFYPP